MAEEQMYSSLKSIFKKKERKVKVQTRNPAREQQALSKHETYLGLHFMGPRNEESVSW